MRSALHMQATGLAASTDRYSSHLSDARVRSVFDQRFDLVGTSSLRCGDNLLFVVSVGPTTVFLLRTGVDEITARTVRLHIKFRRSIRPAVHFSCKVNRSDGQILANKGLTVSVCYRVLEAETTSDPPLAENLPSCKRRGNKLRAGAELEGAPTCTRSWFHHDHSIEQSNCDRTV